MRFTAHMCFCDFVGFRLFWSFGLKLLFFENNAFFRTLRLGLILAKPYYQNARIDRGIIFGFLPNLRNYYKLPVRSGFPVVFLIYVFSLYFINLSGTIYCDMPGPCLLGLCLKCRGFVLSVGALYTLLGLCLVISCSGGPRPLGGRPQAPRGFIVYAM